MPRERLYISGHSAGGHLTAMAMAARWPQTDAPLYLAVGGDELPPLRGQQQQLARQWKRVVADHVELPGENHYSILLQLLDTESALFRSAARMMGLPG